MRKGRTKKKTNDQQQRVWRRGLLNCDCGLCQTQTIHQPSPLSHFLMFDLFLHNVHVLLEPYDVSYTPVWPLSLVFFLWLGLIPLSLSMPFRIVCPWIHANQPGERKSVTVAAIFFSLRGLAKTWPRNEKKELAMTTIFFPSHAHHREGETAGRKNREKKKPCGSSHHRHHAHLFTDKGFHRFHLFFLLLSSFIIPLIRSLSSSFLSYKKSYQALKYSFFLTHSNLSNPSNP